MKDKVIKTIKKYNMLEKGDKVIVGLSGGADSCALLYVLLSLKETFDIEVFACHVNHMIRGEEADRDEKFAENFCKKNNVPFFLLSIDIPNESIKRKISTEQCGREVRYEFFRQTADKLGGKIATAHTASDNAETILFNMARGCGVRGLCGIPPVRENIIRPLIEVTRNEIENYCSENKISFVTDSTNLENNYTRNKIRHDVIPVMKGINPSFEKTITRMCGQMRKNADFIKSCAYDTLKKAQTPNGYQISVLEKTDETVFAECIYILAQKYNVIPESGHIALIKKIMYNGGAVELRCNIFAVSNQGFLRIIKSEPKEKQAVIKYNGQETLIINNKKISLSRMNIEEFHNRKKNDKFLFNISLDYDTIPLSAEFRSRKTGDVFRLPKRNVSKTLKKLFCEIKIPREERDNIIVLADGNNVIWTEVTGAADGFCVKEKTENVLIIDVNVKE